MKFKTVYILVSIILELVKYSFGINVSDFSSITFDIEEFYLPCILSMNNWLYSSLINDIKLGIFYFSFEEYFIFSFDWIFLFTINIMSFLFKEVFYFSKTFIT